MENMCLFEKFEKIRNYKYWVKKIGYSSNLDELLTGNHKLIEFLQEKIKYLEEYQREVILEERRKKRKTCMHELITIQSKYLGYGEYSVVQWCSKCGGIRVDSEYDEQVFVGKFMKFKTPTLEKE